MKDLHGSASALVGASQEECRTLFTAIDRYPDWYPEVVKDVNVLERGESGAPARARARLHIAYGPLVRDFNLVLAVAVEPPGTVKLTRIPNDPSDQERFVVAWLVSGRPPDGAGSRIELDLDATLSVPRLVPLGGIGEAMAQGFVSAAARALGA